MEQTELTVIICGKDNYISQSDTSFNRPTPREVFYEYYGLSGNLADMQQQMLCVQRYFGIEEPLEMIQLVLDYGTLIKDDETVSMYSRSCAEYFSRNHQIYYCIHQDMQSLRYHTHLLINPVSYIDGNIFDIKNINRFCEYLFHLSGIPAKVR